MSESNNAKVAIMVADVVRKAQTGKRVTLSVSPEVSVYADVKDGRTPRGLPLTGSHEMYRLAEDLDRERAELVAVFTLSGSINGVMYENVTIWIQGGRVSLPTLTTFTDKARSLLYGIGRDVARLLDVFPEIMDEAWTEHLLALDGKIEDRIGFLNAVREELGRQLKSSSHAASV